MNAFDQIQFDAATYNDSREKWNDYTYAFSGIHKFNTEGKNMSFDLEYETSKFRSNQFQSAEDQNSNSTIISNDRRGLVPSKLEVFTGKIDFTNPLKEKKI